ncbi:MAG: 16S rRNA (uracil(1498)-N(3))-methyltransferase [Nevskiaceae bacterium]|nr:MAG: 16S rRNA (uracil(1498)-N(3))-methyltransferase [Nevskiaceae bacterium]TBR74322.1 MAG: 16S rRNA (uracil(1498)-N(3))-methyltransferase [Nevskiaceae bacterium]
MTRVHVSETLVAGQALELPPAAAHHVAQVLRLAAGAALVLFDGTGGEYDAVLETVERRSVRVRVGAHRAVERESALCLTLAQCVSKGERMDYTIQKAVELGVTRIQPVLSARSVVKLDAARWAKKREHWLGVIASACEQCGRNRVPELAPAVPLSKWLATRHGLCLVLVPMAQVGLRTLARVSAVSLLVGPEGGLSEDEIAEAQAAGCTAIHLGPRVLRTETAGVATLAALQALWGDLG